MQSTLSNSCSSFYNSLYFRIEVISVDQSPAFAVFFFLKKKEIDEQQLECCLFSLLLMSFIIIVQRGTKVKKKKKKKSFIVLFVESTFSIHLKLLNGVRLNF
jgi:hypothetical protein